MHIAIVNNIAAFLADAVRSVLAQTHADWSLIIVDDGSTDETAAVAAGFQDDRITLIRQANAGVSAARNAGLATCPGPSAGRWPADAILFLDGDDWLAADALETLAAALIGNPESVAAVGCYARVGLDLVTHSVPPPQHGRVLERLLTRNLFANGGHLLIRRSAVEEAGLFRTDLAYGEDWEYWTRLALLGAFAPVASPAPLLFVRERLGGACLSRAADPDAYRPALDSIHDHPLVRLRVGRTRLAALRRRAEAEIAWAVGRELIRHGDKNAGQRWLLRSLRDAPSVKRLMLLGLSGLRLGVFRPYGTIR